MTDTGRPGIDRIIEIRNGVEIHEYENGAIRVIQPDDTPPYGVWMDRWGQDELLEYLEDRCDGCDIDTDTERSGDAE